MEEIYIPQLTAAPEQTEVIQIQEFLPSLETLTPIKGRMRVTHKGNYIEVSAQAETIVTLTCNRCLQQYNHRLKLSTSEIIWLDEAANQPYDGPIEREVAMEDLMETLPPQGYFNPDDWLYQQMCLAIPQQQLCDSQCQGIAVKNDGDRTEQPIDRRWATLETLKQQLQNG